MIEDPGQKNLTVLQFLDELRDRKGYTSIIFPVTEEELNDRNQMFFYKGDILEYQIGTNKLVRAVADGEQFTVKKDGAVYKGATARALFKNDKEFKAWKRACDGDKNALIKDGCAQIHVYRLNPVCDWKELQVSQQCSLCTLRELMAFVTSRDFEALCARYLPWKGQ